MPVAKDTDGENEVCTPGGMAELLAVAIREHTPFLATSALAGVQRLDWRM